MNGWLNGWMDKVLKSNGWGLNGTNENNSKQIIYLLPSWIKELTIFQTSYCTRPPSRWSLTPSRRSEAIAEQNLPRIMWPSVSLVISEAILFFSSVDFVLWKSWRISLKDDPISVTIARFLWLKRIAFWASLERKNNDWII